MDSTGDFVFENNTMQMVEEDDELIQGVWMAIRTLLGEWFLNPLFGFDKFEALGEKFDEERIKDAVYAGIHTVPRVRTVENVELEFITDENEGEKRSLKISFTFTKFTGEELSGEVIA